MNKELFNKFYDITDDIVKIELKYDDFSDIIDSNFGSGYKLSDEFFDKLHAIIRPIPKKYKLNIVLNIKNKTISKEKMQEMLIDNMLFNADKFKLFSFRKIIMSITMIICGLIFFALYYLSLSLEWHDLLTEIFNISAWVFIWEAVTLYFIEFRTDKLNVI